ncbi:MAG: outer membrane beta-barrel protein [Treponema sp.]|jgi:hypothetical protein|nr:outer membrane beta-barrel protein [Treponema sp.]
MKKKVLSLAAALLFFSMTPYFAAAQTAGERVETGRFGASEPAVKEADSGGGEIYNNRWLFLGVRAGPSLRIYTPSDDTAFTGGDTYSASLEAGIQASLQIVSFFSIQAEAVFTWDNASKWQYSYINSDLDRYTRTFTGFSLQFPLMAKLNFYPGKFRVSPFFGGYFILPLGKIKTDSPQDDEESSFSYSFSPPLGLLGGISVGFPLGPGMIFADIRYSADLAEPELKDSGGIDTYRRHGAALSFGYEFGFFKKGKTGSVK